MTGTPFGPGSVLAGRFTLEDLLDDHDGARLWRATDQTLARNVAVHVLPDSDSRADALLTAARTSALVSDGHLLRVLDAAAEGGVVYVVNEWGSGVSLDRLLADGPLSARRAAWVVKEVAEAIATAHRNGVAHGRLLPENVMISEAGSVKLIGFVIDAVLRSDGGREQRRTTGGEPMSAHESDVVNLAALLYAALVGRWPGTEGSAIPAAPSEHGHPLRPRQVRAGVPRPLDAICERVLNAGSHPHLPPTETAHEIYAALSDYVGDPGAAAPLGSQLGHEATALLDRDDLPGSPRPGPARDDTSDLPATGAMTAPASVSGPTSGAVAVPGAVPRTGADPEATQAGMPMFFDEGTGVGWTSTSASRGLRGDGTDPGGSGDENHAQEDSAPGQDADSGPDHDLGSPDGDRDEDDDAAALGAYGSASSRVRHTPPAPPPDRPERPLFADGPSAAAAAAVVAAGSGHAGRASHAGEDDTGSHTNGQRNSWSTEGSVPATWGPDAESAGDDGDDDHERMPGRSWLRLAVALALVLVVVLGTVLVLNLGSEPGPDPTPAQSQSSSPPSSPPVSSRVPISGVTDFDPEGDPPEEHPDLAPLAVDGKPGTAWQTLTYRGNPKLGGLKQGVGLLVDLGKAVQVGDVRLTLTGSPTSLDILAAPDDVKTAPSSTDGLTTVASVAGAGTTADLKLEKKVSTQYLVVWLTSLPSTPGGFKGQVAEISVRS